ncbi:MAG TPA: adenylate/guanylate cyclase domain-containing protein [Vicinamibacteria bacterium]|nr:adenylate/guanylate cyclase domain-containing protein [Vicinamibacteria bacterium]
MKLFAGDLGRTCVVAAVVALAVLAMSAAGVWSALDDALFDSFTVLAAPRSGGPAAVVVVGIDEPSFAEVGKQWPWPRALHARLIEEVARAGASVIAFDVLFSEPLSPEDDAELARAIRDSGRVVLAGDIDIQTTANFESVQRVEPAPAFRAAGAVTGLANVEVAGDQVVRRFPQDPDAMWRVVIARHEALQGSAPAEGRRPPPGAMVRYSDGSDVLYVSYYQALEASTALPPDALRGRIVLVGLALKTTPEVSARRGPDTYATPFLRYSKQFTPGVEVHAQFVAAALAGRSIVPLSNAFPALAATVVLGVGVAFLRRWSVVRSTTLVVSAGAAIVAASFALFEAGYWLPVSAVLGAVAGLYVGRGATAYIDEARRRNEIRRAFEHYVSPAIVAEMTAHPDRLVLGGQRRTLTVMFTDLAGFTTMSEGIAPESVAQILNEHLTLMTGIVLAQGGTIDKFIGDAVMAFWGAPIDDPAHALHGVRAAIEMQAEMTRWRREPGRPELHVRIGLNTGPVVVGNLGSKDRFAYTVIGDAVNLAARLEPLNRLYGTPILLAAETAAAVADAVRLRHVDRVKVKGRSQPVEIYTPENDGGLVEKTEAAIALYRARHWDGAERAWQEVAELRLGDGLASEYLGRIERHRRHGVGAEWDGTFELDTK